MSDPVRSIIEIVGVVIGFGIFLGLAVLAMKISNWIGLFVAKGAQLLCPLVSPGWKLLRNISGVGEEESAIGSPVTVAFAVAAAGFSCWRIFNLSMHMGWDETWVTLAEGSAVGYLVSAFSGVAFEGVTDISYIITSGLNAILMAALAHLFLSGIVQRGEWVFFPLQLVYGVIFVVFCICLGTYLPNDLGLSVPEQWWTMAQWELPQISMGSNFLRETFELWQLYLDMMMRSVVIYLVCLGCMLMISNVLASISCGILGVIIMSIVSSVVTYVFGLFCPGVSIPEEWQIVMVLILIPVPEILLLNWNPGGEDTPSLTFSQVFDEDTTKDFKIHPYATILGGFMGGPFLWIAGLTIFALFTQGFDFQTLVAVFWCIFLFALASVPAILSLRHRGNWNTDGILNYVKYSVFLIPLIMIIVIIFTG